VNYILVSDRQNTRVQKFTLVFSWWFVLHVASTLMTKAWKHFRQRICGKECFTGAFAKLRKATTRFTFVLLFFRMEYFGS